MKKSSEFNLTAKRLLAAALTVLMFSASFAVLAGCGGGKSGGETAAAADATETEAPTETEMLRPDLPDVNFGDSEFRILHWYVPSWGFNNSRDLVAEEETGDPINDAVFRRNMNIEEKYGVFFTASYMDNNELIREYTNVVMSASADYDVIVPRLVDSVSLVTKGYYYDLTSLPYINFENPWWDQGAVRDLSLGGRLFMAASDITIIDKDATSAMIFSKKLAGDLGLPNMYELVLKGGWTLDRLVEYCAGALADLDGDGQFGEGDRYGAYLFRDFAMSCFTGCGGLFAVKDESDLPVFSFYTERNIELCDRILDLMYDPTLCVRGGDRLKMFSADQLLFSWIRLDDVTRMRSSETDFGIIPTPKYDEAQDVYKSCVSVHTCGLLTAPVTTTSENAERIAVILEALAAESRGLLIPAYYDITLKTKYVRDAESVEMLDIIFENRVYDVGDIYGFGTLSSDWLFLTDSGKRDVVSLYEKKRKMIDKDIEKLREALAELADAG
ncbi:MAG TPA: hypothetical protein GX704_02605 [Clostridiales bacterium]|nr:hypothetical protein [Clostridiales bacterium]